MNRINQHFRNIRRDRDTACRRVATGPGSSLSDKRRWIRLMSELAFTREWKPAPVDLLQFSPTHHPE